MNCNAINAILDEHQEARLTAAERRSVDEHLLACADCSASWHAQAELRALRTPPVPATLLERAARAPRTAGNAPAGRARMPIVVGGALLAGAAFAAGLAVITLSRSLPAPAASTAVERPMAQPATDDAPSERVEAARSAADSEHPTSVELVEVALGVQPILRKAVPEYPPDALAQGLEGHVQVAFDVTAAGVVENVVAVESSDARFEDPAVRAVSQWRYLPRIAAGKRVGSNGIRTVIRFALAKDEVATKPLATEAPPAELRELTEFNADLEVAMDRLAADDLRGAELQIDEMQAMYGAGRPDLWSFYGYLYVVQGNYGRAIDAYERSVAIYLQSPSPTSGPWVALANLYFARHQYDIALQTLLRPTQATGDTPPAGGMRRLGPEAEALVERLRALGVTENNLSRGR